MKISEEQFRELLDRYLSNTASSREREILDRFFDSYDAEVTDPGLLSKHPRLQEEILQAILESTGVEKVARASRARNIRLAVVTAISVFVVAWFYLGDGGSTASQPAASALVIEKTAAGQKLLTTLPDGSRVHLNSDSRIAYPTTFDHDVREVTLTGEAYFEVVKNTKPFVVRTGDVSVEVLGTAFNVTNTTGENVAVTLVEGKVSVISPSANSSLKPNQQAVVAMPSGAISTRDVDVLRYISWKENILYFEETDLHAAIATLESWYAVRIDLLNPGLQQCVITAKYQDEPLGNVLSSLQFLLNLEIARVNEKHYTINGTGCK